MHDLTARVATTLLAVAAAVTLGLALVPPDGPELAAQQVQWLTGTTGLVLLVAVAVPAWRWPALLAALLTKGSFLLTWQSSGGVMAGLEAGLLLLLAAAGAVYLLEARREARWNGDPTFHWES